jgi:hypothetical protein
MMVPVSQVGCTTVECGDHDDDDDGGGNDHYLHSQYDPGYETRVYQLLLLLLFHTPTAVVYVGFDASGYLLLVNCDAGTILFHEPPGVFIDIFSEN